MFWSKIWFFLVAVAAGVWLAIALVMPLPAERKALEDEERRLADACAVTNILLTENARVRIDLASDFSRGAGIAKVLGPATKSKAITSEANKSARDAADELIRSISGSIKPHFAYMLDAKGRVVARVGQAVNRTQFGDSMAGYSLVKDALHGYLRDDLWVVNQTLYRVAASPVLRRQIGAKDEYAGVVVLGHPIDNDLAATLASKVKFNVSFYVSGTPVANNTNVEIHTEIITAYEKTKVAGRDRLEDCRENKRFTVEASGDLYASVVARLPGEAGASDAFYAVYVKRPNALGFLGTLKSVSGNDLSFGNFPWIAVGAVFIIVIGIGVFLMIWEADRPLRRLSADAVRLAQGDITRLQEDLHRAKFGSIARSVNIQLDKQEREAKAAKKDLDNLLGPAPGDSDTFRPSQLPASGPAGPDIGEPFVSPPPPSQFQFGGEAQPAGGAKTPPASVADPGDAFQLDLPPPPGPNTPPAELESEAARSKADPTDTRVRPKPITMPGSMNPLAETPPPPPPIPKPPPLPKTIDDDILAPSNLAPPEPEPEPAPTPQPEPAPTPQRPPSDFDAPTRVVGPDHDLLAASAQPGPSERDTAFKKVYEDFLALKKKCGESTNNLTFEKFSKKLEKNRKALMDRHGCKEVKFQVYIKDGKAALKATPVKG